MSVGKTYTTRSLAHISQNQYNHTNSAVLSSVSHNIIQTYSNSPNSTITPSKAQLIASLALGVGNKGTLGGSKPPSHIKRDVLTYDVTALIDAVRWGDKELVIEILQVNDISHFLINAHLNAERETPLLVAASYGRREITKVLLAYGANIHWVNQRGETALHLAAKEGHSIVVKCLLERGANVDCVDRSANTPLHLATVHPKVVELLFQYNATVNPVNHQGRTPLHMACYRGNSAAIELILAKIDERQREIDPCSRKFRSTVIDYVDNEGNTALHLSAYWGNDDAVELLVKQDVKLHIPNNKGKVPLDIAKMREPTRNLIQVLEQALKQELRQKTLDSPHFQMGRDTAIGRGGVLKKMLSESTTLTELEDIIENKLGSMSQKKERRLVKNASLDPKKPKRNASTGSNAVERTRFKTKSDDKSLLKSKSERPRKLSEEDANNNMKKSAEIIIAEASSPDISKRTLSRNHSSDGRLESSEKYPTPEPSAVEITVTKTIEKQGSISDLPRANSNSSQNSAGLQVPASMNRPSRSSTSEQVMTYIPPMQRPMLIEGRRTMSLSAFPHYQSAVPGFQAQMRTTDDEDARSQVIDSFEGTGSEISDSSYQFAATEINANPQRPPLKKKKSKRLKQLFGRKEPKSNSLTPDSSSEKKEKKSKKKLIIAESFEIKDDT